MKFLVALWIYSMSNITLLPQGTTREPTFLIETAVELFEVEGRCIREEVGGDDVASDGLWQELAEAHLRHSITQTLTVGLVPDTSKHYSERYYLWILLAYCSHILG